MRILKGNIFKKSKCKYGNFELKTNEGWEISRTFIDYESKLLVVDTSDRNEENWEDTGFGSRTIPSREYIVDTQSIKILTHLEWAKYFSYETKETYSNDNLYKLITKRVYEPNRDSDGIVEELIDLKSNQKISSSYSLAFSEEKRENLLEQLYKEQNEEKDRLAKIEAMPTLDEEFKKNLSSLKEGDIIINYYNDSSMFELKYSNNFFELYSSDLKWDDVIDWDNVNWILKKSYKTVNKFADENITSLEWFLKYSPFSKQYNRNGNGNNSLLQKFIIDLANKIRKKHSFSSSEYSKINNWSNFISSKNIKPNQFKQYCSNCLKEVRYNARYPKYICSDCSSKKITDENGMELSFSNIGMTGGLRINYINGEKDEDTSQIEKRCFIDDKAFIATEARFGGIVIEKED